MMRTTAAWALSRERLILAVVRTAAWAAILARTAMAAEELPTKPTLVLDAGGHTAIVQNVLFTPDGKELISVSDDKTIRFWDVGSGEPLRVLRPPIGRGDEGRLYAAALSPDGHRLAVGGYGPGGEFGAIYLISLPSGEIERVLKGHTSTIHALTFSPDGRALASGSHDNTARVWEPETGDCRQTLEGHTNAVYGLAFSPDGDRLATASVDRTARLWSVASGKTEAVLKGHEDRVSTVAWSPDGRAIATGSYDESIRLWNPDGTLRKRVDGLGNQILRVAFTADSSGLLYTLGNKVSGQYTVAIVDVETGKPRVQFTRHNNSVYDGSLSADGTLAATAGGNDNEMYVWKTADDSTVHRLAGKGHSTWSCGWSPDGTAIGFGNTGALKSPNDCGPLERSFRLGDLRFGDLPGPDWRRARETAGSITLEKAGEYELAIKRGGQAAVNVKLDVATQYRLNCFTLLSADRAALGCSYGLFLYDVRSGKQLRTFQGHTGSVWAIAPSPDGSYLLSASMDQTLRLWDPEKDEPLLSLFFAGDEWVAWTPDGYYAASPGGEKLMGWHVNNGADKMASFFPAAQFRKSLYRPDVIKLVHKTGSVERAVELADQERGRAGGVVKVEEILPPQVFIIKPDQPSFRITGSKLEVSATAKPMGKDSITAMRLLLNDRPYEGNRGLKNIEVKPAGATAARERWDVVLEPGTHRIVVKAETAKSYGLSDPIEVLYAPEQKKPPTLYVLAVGVSEYEVSRLHLKFAATDAGDLAKAFEKAGGGVFGKVETKVVVDKEATRRGILKGLDWLRTNMRQGDVGVFFYSGHGDKENELFYLVPNDCQPDELSISGVSQHEVAHALQSIPSRLIVMLDACHAGAMAGDTRKDLAGLTDNFVRELVSDDYGVIAMCSSMGREVSREDKSWGHGAFTKALLDGLAGPADLDKDGVIHFTELDHYVTQQVKALTKDRQHVITRKPGTITSFELGKPIAAEE